MRHRQTETYWRAIIKHIHCIAVDFERLGKGLYGERQSIERVNILPFGRYLGKSEAREIRRDDAIMISETWNELAEHERRCREPMQQENHRGPGVTCLPVEDLDTISFDLADGRGKHREQALS